MPDITMCTAGAADIEETLTCPLRRQCYRYMATPNPYWQSYADFTPSLNHDNTACLMRMPYEQG